jgi:hypothetical protein
MMTALYWFVTACGVVTLVLPLALFFVLVALQKIWGHSVRLSALAAEMELRRATKSTSRPAQIREGVRPVCVPERAVTTFDGTQLYSQYKTAAPEPQPPASDSP